MLRVISSDAESDDADIYIPPPDASGSKAESEEEGNGYSSELVVQPLHWTVKVCLLHSYFVHLLIFSLQSLKCIRKLQAEVSYLLRLCPPLYITYTL